MAETQNENKQSQNKMNDLYKKYTNNFNSLNEIKKLHDKDKMQLENYRIELESLRKTNEELQAQNVSINKSI